MDVTMQKSLSGVYKKYRIGSVTASDGMTHNITKSVQDPSPKNQLLRRSNRI